MKEEKYRVSTLMTWKNCFELGLRETHSPNARSFRISIVCSLDGYVEAGVAFPAFIEKVKKELSMRS